MLNFKSGARNLSCFRISCRVLSEYYYTIASNKKKFGRRTCVREFSHSQNRKNGESYMVHSYFFLRTTPMHEVIEMHTTISYTLSLCIVEKVSHKRGARQSLCGCDFITCETVHGENES
jgi:hypothetical protein